MRKRLRARQEVTLFPSHLIGFSPSPSPLQEGGVEMVPPGETDNEESRTCVAVDGTGEEHSHKWRGGEARVVKFDDTTGEEIEYVFAVRVELVSVAPL